MIMKKYLKYTAICQQWGAAVLALCCLASCNKDFPNTLKTYDPQTGYAAGSAKVLYIIADGLRGKALQDLEPTNLANISKNALYAYGSLVDYSTHPISVEEGMLNLLTGVTSAKHGVKNNDLTSWDKQTYPSIIQRINELDLGYTTAAYSTSPAIVDGLFKDADESLLVTSDEEVFTNTKARLAEEDAALVLAHFSDVEHAAQANSYESTDPQYKEAILSFDNYVGELVASLKTRPNYSTENWLVIITSTKGGTVAPTEVDNTVFGDFTRNTFTYLYSPKFSRRFLAKPNSTEIPYTANAVRYTYGSPSVNATLQHAEDYNFGTTKDFTISFNIKSNIPDGNWNYPVIFSKREAGFGGQGWNFFGEVRDGAMACGFNTNIAGQVFTKKINDGKWHNVTLVVERSGVADSVRMYHNGLISQTEVANANNLDNPAGLVIGKKAPDGNASPDILISNVQIYNSALSKAAVLNNAGITHLAESNPYYDQLIGYWPGYDDAGSGRLTDLSPLKNNMTLTGPYSWQAFNDLVSYFKPPIFTSFYRIVPNSVDAPFMIYQWLGIIPNSLWGLDGKSWTPTYTAVK